MIELTIIQFIIFWITNGIIGYIVIRTLEWEFSAVKSKKGCRENNFYTHSSQIRETKSK